MSPARTWVVDFADRDEARRDVAAVLTYQRRAVEAGLQRLEDEGPCIGLRLRGSGFDRFCRYAVPTVKGQWRIIYEWPADDPADNLILVYAIGAHTRKSGDVYASDVVSRPPSGRLASSPECVGLFKVLDAFERDLAGPRHQTARLLGRAAGRRGMDGDGRSS